MKDILSQSQHQQEMFKQTLEAMQTMITKGHDPEARPRRSSMSRPRSPAPRARSPDKNDVGSKHRSPSQHKTDYIDRYLSKTDLTQLPSDDHEKAGLYPVLRGLSVAQRAALENTRSSRTASLKAVPPDARLAQSLVDERNYVRRTVADPILDSMQFYQRYHEVGDALYPDQLSIDFLAPDHAGVMATRDFDSLIKRYRPKELFKSPSQQFATLLQKICREQDSKLTESQVQELVNACCGGDMSRAVLLIFEGYDINDALNEIYKRFGNIPHRYDLENALLNHKISAKNFRRDMDKYEHAMRESRKSSGLPVRNLDRDLIHECRPMLPKDFRRKAIEMICHYREQEKRGHPPLTWLHFRDALIKFGRDNNHFPANSDINKVATIANHSDDETEEAEVKAATSAKGKGGGKGKGQGQSVKNTQAIDMNKITEAIDAKFVEQSKDLVQLINNNMPKQSAPQIIYAAHPGAVDQNNNPPAKGANQNGQRRDDSSRLRPVDRNSDEHKVKARQFQSLVGVEEKIDSVIREVRSDPKKKHQIRSPLLRGQPDQPSQHRWNGDRYHLDGKPYEGAIFMSNSQGTDAVSYSVIRWATEHCFRCGCTHCGADVKSCPYFQKTPSWYFCARCNAGFHLNRDCKCYLPTSGN